MRNTSIAGGMERGREGERLDGEKERGREKFIHRITPSHALLRTPSYSCTDTMMLMHRYHHTHAQRCACTVSIFLFSPSLPPSLLPPSLSSPSSSLPSLPCAPSLSRALSGGYASPVSRHPVSVDSSDGTPHGRKLVTSCSCRSSCLALGHQGRRKRCQPSRKRRRWRCQVAREEEEEEEASLHERGGEGVIEEEKVFTINGNRVTALRAAQKPNESLHS